MIEKDLLEEAYNKYKRKLINNVQKSSELQAYIVGGQPGAGKSTLVDKIKGDRDDIIFINGDHIRTYYPGAKKISMEDYPTVTQPFVNMCVERLIDELSDEKYNLIIEGTLRDKKNSLKNCKPFKRERVSCRTRCPCCK